MKFVSESETSESERIILCSCYCIHLLNYFSDLYYTCHIVYFIDY